MASMGYLSVSGEQQGRIEGSGRRGAEEGLIELIAFDHCVELPRRGESAVAAGRPVHRDIEVVKLVDRASPRLYQALIQGELLSEAVFEWYRQTGKGEQELYYSVQLKNAVLTRLQPWMPDYLDPAQDRYRFLEKLAFSYETILWSYGPAGDVQFEASWSAEGE